jgi:hypothetical protein
MVYVGILFSDYNSYEFEWLYLQGESEAREKYLSEKELMDEELRKERENRRLVEER